MAANVIDARYEVVEPVPGLDGPHITAVKARDVEAGRILLLRSFTAADGKPVDLPGLKEKAAAAAAVANNRIGPTIDIGAPGDGVGAYVVSEFARGITLDERIRRVAPFSLAVSVDIGIAIAEALAAAHEHGLAHGGLTPSNVQLTPEGEIRVLDFGIAAELWDSVGGRPPGYAPLNEDPISPAADVYAWGAAMHEMLTGQSPTPLEQHHPLSPRVVNAGVPTTLEGIVGRATDPDPAARYPDAHALLQDLGMLRDAMKAGKPLTWLPMAPGAAGAATKDVDADDRASADGADDEDQDEGRNPLGNAVRILFIIVVLGVIGLVWYAFRMMSVPGDIVVPRLVGKTIDDAQRMAAQQGFQLVQRSDFSDRWPENQIYMQDPGSGHAIKSGRPVTVYVSMGSRYVYVPKVLGKTQNQAVALLKDANLGPPDVVEQYEDKVAKGLVISQTPEANSRIERNGTVRISISLGHEPPDPPDGVIAEPTNTDQVRISWQAAARATSYRVSRIVDGQSTVVADKLQTTSYTDSGLKAGASYSYTVTSINAVGESEPSDPALAVTPSVSPVAPLISDGDNSGDGSNTDAPPGNIRRRQFEVEFRVPRTVNSQRHVQIEIVDSTGTTQVYDRMLDPGATVDAQETGFGDKITFRIYLDGQLVKQKVL